MHDRSPDELLREVSWLRRLARSLVADRATADDLAGETLAAWSAERAPVRRARAWLATVLRHFAERHHRRDQRRRRTEAAAAAPHVGRAADESLATAELHRNLVDAVLALDEPFRSPIVMRYLDEMPLHEVARRLGIPPETARTRLRRGLDRLRARLDERHGGRAGWATLVAGGIGPARLLPFLPALMTMKILLPACIVLLAVFAWFTLQEPPLPPAGAEAADDRTAASRSTSTDEPVTRGLATAGNSIAESNPDRPVAITGRAIDEATRLPIEGVTVSLVATNTLAAARVQAAETKTGSDGRFALTTAVPSRIPTAILMRHGTHARRTLELRGAEDSQSGVDLGEIEMAPGTVVNGTVFDAEGGRAARAALFVCRDSYWTEAGRIVRLDEAAPIARANDDGSFVLDERLVPNRPAPLLIATSELGVGFSDLEGLQRNDATVRVDVHILPSTTVRVRAVDPGHGPVANALVVGEPRFLPLRLPGTHPIFVERVPGLADAFSRRTDAAGRATLRLPLLADGASTAFTLRAEAEGRDTAVVPIDAPHDDEVELPLPKRRELLVTGHVVDKSGRGIAGASARVRWATEATASTDAEGAFRVVIPRGQGPLSIEATAPNALPKRVQVQPTALAESHAVTLALDPAIVLTGRVTDQHGRPVARANVWLDDGDAAIATDANGTFLGPVPSDRPVLVHVTPPPPNGAFEGSIDHLVAAGQRDVAIVVTRRAEGRASLDARLLDANGGPLEAQRIVLRHDGEGDDLDHPATATIGRVTASSLAPGDWTLRVVPSLGCEVIARFTVCADGERIEPVLQQPGGVSIDGEVRFEASAPLPPDVAISFASAGQSAHFVALPGQITDATRTCVTLDPARSTAFRIEDVDPARRLALVATTAEAIGELTLATAAPGARATIVVRPFADVRLASREPFHGTLLLQLRRPGGAWGDPIRYLGFEGATDLFRQPVASGAYEWRVRLPTRGLANTAAAPWRTGTFSIAPGATATIELP